MSTGTAEDKRSVWSTVLLFRIPTLEQYSGKEGFAFVAPKHIVGVEPFTATIGQEDPGSKKVQGTLVRTVTGVYFVPLNFKEVASLLYIELVNPTSQTGAQFRAPDNANA